METCRYTRARNIYWLISFKVSGTFKTFCNVAQLTTVGSGRRTIAFVANLKKLYRVKQKKKKKNLKSKKINGPADLNEILVCLIKMFYSVNLIHYTDK
jgi:hypothetical protein